MSVCSPPAMCGQPLICGGVGVGNDDANHSRTAGEKASSTEWWAISRGYLATRVRGTPVLPTDSVRVHAALSGRQGRKPRGDLSRNHSSAGYFIILFSHLASLQFKSIWYSLSISKETIFNVFSLVAVSLTFGAQPASLDSSKRVAQRHQASPGLRPGKFNSGRGVIKSLPCKRE